MTSVPGINSNTTRDFFRSAKRYSNNYFTSINLHKLFTDNTIFHAMDWKRLSLEREQYSRLSRLGKIWLGIKAGPLLFARMTVVKTCMIMPILMRENPKEGFGNRSRTHESWVDLFANMGDVIAEEIIFRGGVQRGIGFLGFSDPRIAILGSTTLFAWAHFLADAYSPGQGVRDPLRGFYLATTLTVLPTLSILYYTTGSLYAPIAAHAMCNVTAALYRRMLT